jgi:hypothetical protein
LIKNDKIPNKKYIKAYVLASVLALALSLLKLMRIANIFDKKILNVGKIQPLIMATKIPPKKVNFYPEAYENNRPKMDS